MPAQLLDLSPENKSINIWVDLNSRNEIMQYQMVGYIHFYSNWKKIYAKRPNENIINVCSDGIYRYNNQNKIPLYTYWIRHHIFGSCIPNNNSGTELEGIKTYCVDISKAETDSRRRQRWFYNPETNTMDEINTCDVQFNYVTSVNNQQAYILNHYFNYDFNNDISGLINVYSLSDKRLLDYVLSIPNDKVPKSNYVKVNNIFNGSIDCTDDFPNFNPNGIKNCPTVLIKSNDFIPKNKSNMSCWVTDSVSNNTYIIGFFGCSEYTSIESGHIQCYGQDGIQNILDMPITIQGIFSYYRNEQDILDMVGKAGYIANFDIGDRLVVCSFAGVTEIIVGAEYYETTA